MLLNLSMSHFLSTGSIGPVRLDSTVTEIVSALGPPEAFEHFKGLPSILLYGALQLHVSASHQLVFFELVLAPGGSHPIGFHDWSIDSIDPDEVVSQLIAHNVEVSINKTLLKYGVIAFDTPAITLSFNEDMVSATAGEIK